MTFYEVLWSVRKGARRRNEINKRLIVASMKYAPEAGSVIAMSKQAESKFKEVKEGLARRP